MKIKPLVVDVIAVGSPTSAENEKHRVVLDNFLLIQVAVVIGQPLCDLKMFSWVLIFY